MLAFADINCACRARIWVWYIVTFTAAAWQVRTTKSGDLLMVGAGQFTGSPEGQT
jgi:hypothetical protein